MKASDAFLPTSKDEFTKLGWDQADVILFSGDAYVDHPAFGAAIIGRYLQSHGFRVAIVPQPNWRDDLRDFIKLGKPRLFFGVTAGNMDSMVNHYTAAKRLRSDDAFTPGGIAGFRPDYPTIVYAKALRGFFPDTPLVIGGIEASLRRLTHYDYWQDGLRESILVESGADLLVYGMGERGVLEIARALSSGKKIQDLDHIPQTVIVRKVLPPDLDKPIVLPSFDECKNNKRAFAKAFSVIERESNRLDPAVMVEKTGMGFLIVNPPYPLASEKELDECYALPFTRLPHPRYAKRGSIPAYEMIRHSVNIHRGCFGGCAFCTISAHQGKFVSSRSEESVLKEVGEITRMPDFKGYITDLGGPSANMYRMQGVNMDLCRKCSRPSCIFPSICKNLDTSHRPLIQLYDKAIQIKGVKKVFIGSGLRYDLFINRPAAENSKNRYQEYFFKLVTRHVSGRLKVAPEHTSDKVLEIMRKPSFKLFRALKDEFDLINRKQGIHQQLIPYFISSHPGCTLDDMANLAEETRSLGYKLEQVQDLTPTPMTLASVMYFTGLDPDTLKPVHVARSKKDKDDQRRFFFWYKPENRAFVESRIQQKRKLH